MKNLNINIYDTRYIKDSIILKVNESDLSKIKKFYFFDIINYYGPKTILNNLKINRIYILYFLIILFLIFVYTRFIIDIDVLTNNQELRGIVLNELDKQSISKYTLIKKDKKLLSIKEQIIKNNNDLIEWLNIERKGMKYIINIEPKIEKNKNIEEHYCNIISTKDALISRIYSKKGIEMVDINDSVKKGDTLISGDIIYNNETKNQVCASGMVYGKTWYTINITIPKTYEKTARLAKERYNILIKHNNKKYKIFKPRLETYEEETKKIINIFGLEIYLEKEIEISITNVKYTEEELNLKIEELTNDKMSKTLNGKNQIIDRKVLKKQDNNSTIDIELFIVAEEQISKVDTTDINNKTE